MASFLRTMMVLTISILCIAVIAFVFGLPTLEKRARNEIVSQLKEKLDANVELRAVRLSSIWPLGIRLQDFKISTQTGPYKVEVGRIYIRYHYLTENALEVNIE